MYVVILSQASVANPDARQEFRFDSAAEATRQLRRLRRQGRTAWLKGDKRYAKVEHG